MKMKTILFAVLVFVFISGCQIYHTKRLMSKYPECANEPTQADFIRCANEKYNANLLDNTNIPIWDWKEAPKKEVTNE